MNIIESLNLIAECLEDKNEHEVFAMYRVINTLWENINNLPNNDHYLYNGEVHIAIALDRKRKISNERIIAVFDDYPLGMTSRDAAILFSKDIVRNKRHNIFKKYDRYILSGKTVEGININEIMKDYPNEKCSWDYIKRTSYRDDIVLIMPGSITDIELTKLN